MNCPIKKQRHTYRGTEEYRQRRARSIEKKKIDPRAYEECGEFIAMRYAEIAKKVLSLHGEGLTRREIGEILGVSSSYVYNTLNRNSLVKINPKKDPRRDR